MLESIRLDHLTNTNRTLLIPLSGRAYGATYFPKMGFLDLKAQEWADRIDYDRALFTDDRQAVWGTLLRTQVFDQIAREFIDQNPDGFVVNLGAGLCTRYFRLAVPQGITWLELDLPEVIKIKERFCTSTEKFRLISFDLGSESAWSELTESLTRPTLVLSEGVFMFLPPAAVDAVFSRFLRLPNPSLKFAFDYLHPWIRRFRWLQPKSFRATGASYLWAVRSMNDLLTSQSQLRLITDQALSARFPWRLKVMSWILRRIAGLSPYDIAVVEKIPVPREIAASLIQINCNNSDTV